MQKRLLIVVSLSPHCCLENRPLSSNRKLSSLLLDIFIKKEKKKQNKTRFFLQRQKNQIKPHLKLINNKL